MLPHDDPTVLDEVQRAAIMADGEPPTDVFDRVGTVTADRDPFDLASLQPVDLDHLLAADAARQASGELGDAWWTARPALEHIRTAARSRRVAPTAVLGCVLARIAAATPPSTVIPAFVGSTVPLSTFVALIAQTGGAKSSPTAVARDLLPTLPAGVVGPLPLGSGEGVADAFLELVDHTDDTGKKQRRKKQTRHGALLTLDEGRTLADMASRRGATIVPTLCTAWTGGDLGQANATAETRRHLPAGGYSVGLVSAWQPSAAAGLFDEAEGGLPGRFVFLPTDDPDAPDSAPNWPGPIDWRPPNLIRLHDRNRPTLLHYDPAIAAEVDDERLARLRGEHQPDPLDAHSTLGRLKLAGLLTVLEQRDAVTIEDWQLAGQLVTVSNRVRDRVLGHLAADAARRERATIDRHVRREEAVAESAESRAFQAAARAVARKAHRHADEVLARKVFTVAVKGSDRALVDMAAVLDHAVAEGWLEAVDENHYRAGRNEPA